MTDWVRTLLADEDMLQMGHGQTAVDHNLGLGHLYYGLARALRPRTVVVIGSWRGFVPIILAKAISENEGGGVVHFIDPSLVDDFWRDPGKTRAHFESHGVTNVHHHLATTQEFLTTDANHALASVDLLFIDGLHSLEQVRFDYEAFRSRLSPDAVVLFHDSARVRLSRIYGDDRPYEHQVKLFVDELRTDSSLDVFDLPIDAGVTLVRKRSAT